MSTQRRIRRQSNKKRQDRLEATVTATSDDLSFSYDTIHDKIEIHNAKIESMRHEKYYERESGKDKIVSQTPCHVDKGFLNQFDSLTNNIDYLFAIDTNTVEINQKRRSFSASCFLPKPLFMYGNAFQILPFIGFVIFDVNSRVNPECIGWHLLIDCIVNNQAYDLRRRIGIVVDSELGKLKGINSRQEPYYSAYLIPENIQLLYAYDKGKDLTNTILKFVMTGR